MYLYYSIPCALYAVYNNLSFYAVSHSDPTTYTIFLQTKSLAIALIYQILFKEKLNQGKFSGSLTSISCIFFLLLQLKKFYKKTLSKEQWGSLILLTIGCIMKQVSFKNGFEISWSSALPIIFIQITCSCFATVSHP